VADFADLSNLLSLAGDSAALGGLSLPGLFPDCKRSDFDVTTKKMDIMKNVHLFPLNDRSAQRASHAVSSYQFLLLLT
jgi:hypothetical protein